MTHTGILAALRELIGALDRRTPQTHLPSETGIASDAQQLRQEAVARIEELTGAGTDGDANEQDLVQASMPDDADRG